MKRSIFLPILIALGCNPRLERPSSRIAEPRVLAVVLEPPEASAGQVVVARVLAVDQTGRLSSDTAAWSVCSARPDIADYNSVAESCARASGDQLEVIGSGASVDVRMPSTACALFGSEPPPAQGGTAPLRPVDPDETGGYFLPIRVDVAGVLAFGGARLSCALPLAPSEIARAYRDGYVANKNPRLLPLEVPKVVRRGERVVVKARYEDGSREPYLYYDVRTTRLAQRVESLEARFFSTFGTFSAETAPGDDVLTSDLVVTDHLGKTVVWVVVRDERGGAAFVEAEVFIE